MYLTNTKGMSWNFKHEWFFLENYRLWSSASSLSKVIWIITEIFFAAKMSCLLDDSSKAN